VEVKFFLLAQEECFEKHHSAKSFLLQANTTSSSWSYTHGQSRTNCGGHYSNESSSIGLKIDHLSIIHHFPISINVHNVKYVPNMVIQLQHVSIDMNLPCPPLLQISQVLPPLCLITQKLSSWVPYLLFMILYGIQILELHITLLMTRVISYHGADVVQIGNGKGLKINHVGNAHFTIPHTHTLPFFFINYLKYY